MEAIDIILPALLAAVTAIAWTVAVTIACLAFKLICEEFS